MASDNGINLKSRGWKLAALRKAANSSGALSESLKNRLKESVNHALEGLDEAERLTLIYLFGLNGEDSATTPHEVAERLNATLPPERVLQEGGHTTADINEGARPIKITSKDVRNIKTQALRSLIRGSNARRS